MHFQHTSIIPRLPKGSDRANTVARHTPSTAGYVLPPTRYCIMKRMNSWALSKSSVRTAFATDHLPPKTLLS